MEKLLQKLLEAEILTEDTKQELEEAFKGQLDEAIQAAKSEEAANVRAELTEAWVVEKDALIEGVDLKVGEFLDTEITELKEDIERFRDLEAEYAEKLVESKAAMSQDLKKDLKELVEKIDSFLEIRLAAEMEELKEDLDEVRKNDFGRRIFEAYSEEFVSNYSDEDSASATVSEMQNRLEEMEGALAESEESRKLMERAKKMEEVLSPLAGHQHEVMEAILKTVDTESLEEGYKTFIGRVLRETTEEVTSSEKEDKVLAESTSDDKDGTQDKTIEETAAEKGVLLTGDNEEPIVEAVDAERLANLDEIRKLAGIT